MTIKNFLTAIILFFLTSCTVTNWLWTGKNYKEEIQQFYIGADGRYVVLVGAEYHYILTDNSGRLKEILGLKQSGILTVDVKKSRLKLDGQNNISGVLVLEGPFTVLPEGDKQILLGLGLKPDKKGDLSVKMEISGKRYVAKYLGANISQASNTFILPIYYGNTNIFKGAAKAAVTPVAVTLDAVLLIGKIVIFPMNK